MPLIAEDYNILGAIFIIGAILLVVLVAALDKREALKQARAEARAMSRLRHPAGKRRP